MTVLRLLLATAILAMANAIYPDDHWNYSKRLTADNFEFYIKENIQRGKTTFAPAWNAVAKAFAANDDVAFGDVNLSEDQVPGNHRPGAGGWPTIRYFNKDTGIAGGSYNKKTGGAMCEELGDDAYMTAYVEEYAGTSLCSVIDGKGCNEKEIAYIEKMKSKDAGEIEQQIVRLKGMDSKSMKADLRDWVNKRKKILSKLAEESSALKEEL